MKVIVNNKNRFEDVSGTKIEAHGGGFIKKGEFYYWFGENRHDIKKVSCYRSSDLKNWEFRNHVLTLNSSTREHYIKTDLSLNPFSEEIKKFDTGATIERPKVLYNEYNDLYVMWMHYEDGKDYSQARCAVAVSEAVDGDYTYLGSFRPLGHMSRDCTLFKDEDNRAYFISAANNNADLHVYRLTRDYLNIDELVNVLWPGQYREAPVMIKKDRNYIMITSGCTGWQPNQSKYGYTTNLKENWTELKNLGNETTYDTQPTYVIKIKGSDKTNYLYIGDRWDGDNYHNSKYKFLPLDIVKGEKINCKLKWAKKVVIDFETGDVYPQKNKG
ncbi:MAG: family 43 glycosylhydrolase [bacterium]